ncbi:hypothetical protein KEM54_005419, partial [Ascosphaera aggregata]
SSPIEQGPVYTASGRQVKARQGGMYGEILSYSRGNDRSSSVVIEAGDENDSISNGRPSRGGPLEVAQRSYAYQSDGWNSERVENNESDGSGSRNEWKTEMGEYNDADDDVVTDEGSDGSGEEAQRSLVVHLQYRKTNPQSAATNGSATFDTGAHNGIQSSPPTASAATNGNYVPSASTLNSTHNSPAHNAPTPVVVERLYREEKLKENVALPHQAIPSPEGTERRSSPSTNPLACITQLEDSKPPSEEQQPTVNGHSGMKENGFPKL